MINAKWMADLEARNPIVKKINDVLYLAPAMKWGLSIVPITLAFSGGVPPEKIDLKQSAALFTTGAVWTYYAFCLMAKNPGMWGLASVNSAMAAVHGYNLYRGYNYRKSQAAAVHEN